MLNFLISRCFFFLFPRPQLRFSNPRRDDAIFKLKYTNNIVRKGRRHLGFGVCVCVCVKESGEGGVP